MASYNNKTQKTRLIDGLTGTIGESVCEWWDSECSQNDRNITCMMAGLSPAAATAGSRWILHRRPWICINCVGSAFYKRQKTKKKHTQHPLYHHEHELRMNWVDFHIRCNWLHSRFSHKNLVDVQLACDSRQAFHVFYAPVFCTKKKPTKNVNQTLKASFGPVLAIFTLTSLLPTFL